VANVRVRQKKIFVANRGDTPTLFRAPADGHVFAEDIIVAYDQFDPFVSKRIVLRVASYHTERMKHIFLAEFRRPMHRRVRVQDAAVPQFDFFPNNSVSPDFDTPAELRARRHNRLRVNL